MRPQTRLALLATAAVVATSCGAPGDTIDVTQLFAQITPAPGAIALCQSVQLQMTMVDQFSRTVVPDSVLWSTSDAVAAPISAAGVVRARAVTPAVTITAVGFAHGIYKTALGTWSVPAPATGAPASCP